MALELRSLLVAVDFGEASARAVAVGGFIAARCRTDSLRLLHSESIEAPVYFTAEQLDRLERERHMLQAQAERFLTQFGREHTPVPFAVTVDTLTAVDAILRGSAASDLVVMGTHGRRGPSRWWLGSVAERVLREIARPLLVVRADMKLPITSLFDRMLVHDLAPDAGTETRQFAQEFAVCFGGEIVGQRDAPIESAVEGTRASIAIVALPEPRTASWLSTIGERLVRSCSVPILFVPTAKQGV